MRLKRFFQHAHGFWTVPIIFFLYYMVGILLSYLFGYGTGFYDPAFIQPLFLAGAVVFGATSFTLLILFLTFKGLYKYIYGRKDRKGDIINESKDDWQTLTVWQRFIISFSVFFLFLAAVILVYLKMV